MRLEAMDWADRDAERDDADRDIVKLKHSAARNDGASLVVPENGDDEESSGGPSAGEADAASTDPRQLRVLIVEDEAIIALEIESMLDEMDAEVVGVALSAQEAVALAAARQPDCVLMDIYLRGERDGISAAIEIFERFGIRSVFVTAYCDAETVARGDQAGPLAWVPKPIRRETLVAALQRVSPGSDDSS